MASVAKSSTAAVSFRQLASIFSRRVFAELGKGQLPDSVAAAKRNLFGKTGTTVATVLEHAYAEIRSGYRTEYVYKNELASKVLFGRHSPKVASMVTEMRIGASILDVAIFNGTSSAYEIKTEYDNFARLEEQLSDYSKVFDKVVVVTHPKAADAALAIAPSHVGVLAFNAKGALSVRREAVSNQANIAPAAVFHTLRQAEYLNILARTHGWEANVPRGLLFKQAKNLFCELPPAVAHDEAVAEWRKRTTDVALAEFVSSLPASLRALAISEPLSGIGRQRLQGSISRLI